MVPLPDEVLRAKARQGVSDAELSDFRMKYDDEAKELQSLEVERQRLQDLLDRVEERRTAIQQSMHQIVFLTSPISRLSDDIIGHLVFFISSLSYGANFLQDTWNFAQVNTQWRSVALSTRRLWTHLYLFNISQISPNMLQEVLRRSGGLPLTINVWSDQRDPGGEDEELILAEEHEICVVLSQSSRQWHDISLVLPGSFYASAFQNMHGNLPLLKKLHLQNDEFVYPTDPLQKVPAYFLDSDLHEIHLGGIDADVGPSQWQNVTQLVLENLDWEVVARLVPHFSKSVVNLEISCPDATRHPTWNTVVVMQKLKVLRIEEFVLYRSVSGELEGWRQPARLLQSLSCPKLHTFALGSCEPEDVPKADILSVETLRMMQRSGPALIYSLTIGFTLSESHLMYMLKGVPSIHELTISGRWRETKDMEIHPSTLFQELQTLLLPNLQNLRIFNVSRIWSAELDSMMLDLLEHRCESTSLSTISRLYLSISSYDTPHEYFNTFDRERASSLLEKGVKIRLGPWYVFFP